MQAESPHIVGIAGGSCAGKTWLADRVQNLLKEKAIRLSLDDFYRDRSHLSPIRRARVNFDRPQAIDWERVEEVLTDLAKGRSTAAPRYDFVTHGRVPEDFILHSAPVVLVEGLWLFRRPSLRKLFALKIYIRSTTDLCTERRVRRDTSERGRTHEEVLAQLQRDTLPMFERFVAPQEKWADVILDAPVRDNEVRKLANRIQNQMNISVGI